MKRLPSPAVVFSVLLALMAVGSLPAWAQQRDTLGVHDLSAGTSPVHGSNANACLYCHAPHSGNTNGPLWSHQFSKQSFTNSQLYTSETMQNAQVSPAVGSASSLCLSCHDGTVAVGQTLPYGQISTTGTLSDPMQNLSTSHPFSLMATPPEDAASLLPSLHNSGTTGDQTNAVKLIKNNVECTSCHEPHHQDIDKYSQNFLAIDSSKGKLCLSCHTTTERTVKGISNPLLGWEASAHVTTSAAYKPSAGLGGYTTIADSACMTCHMTHNAGGAKGLLRHSTVAVANADDASQSCINCHNGGSDKLVTSILDVYSEIASKKSHPFPDTSNVHKLNEAVVLDGNRHASCVDCHNAHASKESGSGTLSGAPAVRPSQFGVKGVAADGSSLSGSAVNQYENCLRCHGASVGKARQETTYGYLPTRQNWGGDELNLIVQMGNAAVSSHPVMHDAYPNAATEPSLLTAMLTLSGTASSRTLQPGPTRLFCTDCHNNDQNREFGGTGPNGPHGSTYDHILEREYTISKVNEGATWPSGGPGTLIANPVSFSTPYPKTSGPFALCAKCHNLDNIAANASFSKHSTHLAQGISCSVCHTAHGVPAGGTGGSGTRLVNFDVRVVAPNGSSITYNANGTCNLTCHMVRHYDNGGTQGIEQLTSASSRPF